jgi:excisionase family DNA binding protein
MYVEMLERCPDVMSAEDVMNVLGIGKNMIYKLLNSGAIQGFRIGRDWKITKEALDNYLFYQVH